MRDSPADFRLACEQVGITIADLADRFTNGRKDNVRKWWKTQVPPDAAWEWLAEREQILDEGARDIAENTIVALKDDPEHELLTYRTDEPLQSHPDSDMTALQHRHMTSKARALINAQGYDVAVEFWEDY